MYCVMVSGDRIRAAWLALAVFGLGAVISAPAAADSPLTKEEERALRDGAAKIIEGIESIIRAIPTYGLPEIDADGNIIIPRRSGPLHREDEPHDQDEHRTPETDEDPYETSI